LRPAAALDQPDESVDVHPLDGERGRQSRRETGLCELAAPPGRDRGALGSIWFEDGPHDHVRVRVSPFLTELAVKGTTPCRPVANGSGTRQRRCAMPWGDWINELPMGFFLAVHIAAFAIGATFAWTAHTRGLSLLTWAFALFALAEISYMTYHLDWTVFLFAHTISEVLDLVAFVLVFAAAVVRVAAPTRAPLEAERA
jgi:hypothetical protein